MTVCLSVQVESSRSSSCTQWDPGEFESAQLAPEVPPPSPFPVSAGAAGRCAGWTRLGARMAGDGSSCSMAVGCVLGEGGCLCGFLSQNLAAGRGSWSAVTPRIYELPGLNTTCLGGNCQRASSRPRGRHWPRKTSLLSLYLQNVNSYSLTWF